MNTSLNIIIADDHPLIVQGLKAVIKENSPHQVVATAANGRELLQLLHSHKCQVIILDINMPLLTGPEAAKEIKLNFPKIKILCISMQHDAALIRKLEQLGVDGFLPKNISPHHCLEAIAAITQGQTFFQYAKPNPLQITMEDGTTPLTNREREIIQLVKEGHTTKAIAEQLSKSTHTIDTHRKNICRKLGIKEANALLKYLIDNPDAVK